MRLLPFDLVFVSGRGWISDVIRWATSDNLPPLAATHVGFIIEGSRDPNGATVQEAIIELRRIVRRPLGVYAGTGEDLAIFRPLTLTGRDLVAMHDAADDTLGGRYGIGNIALQLVDAVLGKLFRRRVRLARRLAGGRFQICSQNVACVWNAAGLSFGVEPGTATPEDVLAFCLDHPDHYKMLRLGPLLSAAKREEPCPTARSEAEPRR